MLKNMGIATTTRVSAASDDRHRASPTNARLPISTYAPPTATSSTPTPTGASVLPNAHYSLGSWCESWDSLGTCSRNSSIGLFGVYPWVEKTTGRFGIIFPYVRNDAFRFWPDMEVIRNEVQR